MLRAIKMRKNGKAIDDNGFELEIVNQLYVASLEE